MTAGALPRRPRRPLLRATRAQHRARLDERPTQLEPGAMSAQRDAVLALWRAVFGDAAASPS